MDGLGLAVAAVLGLEVDLGARPRQLGVLVALVGADDLQAGLARELLRSPRLQVAAVLEELGALRRDDLLALAGDQ
ncbi:hypothetical protein CS053_08250 [Rhodanobacter glycinis]|uniref:Uncharacterized protein n=1 Tax=Rhodanobacter glycinis TaxID=582702 RepID=A0A5B9E1E9_9GAMM|nr:hypothetical protein [Rhodanobacter glycinis]QEE24491.1 hypothetical protein CS053_08250 [Rhodanobacter glycinis]